MTVPAVNNAGSGSTRQQQGDNEKSRPHFKHQQTSSTSGRRPLDDCQTGADARNNRNNQRRNQQQAQPRTQYVIPEQPQDENLPANLKDPRGEDPNKRITKKATSRGAGRNTESFDPTSTLVRPDVRVLVGSPAKESYEKPMKHDDVIVVPELFGREDDWTMYYQLIKEMTELQEKQIKGSEWISWHEGAHLIVKNPQGSPTFTKIIDKLCAYFQIDAKSAGTRFNWYRDSADWKAFHHDSAAFNPKRAKSQNITVGVSFGATRELAFLRADHDDQQSKQQPARIYFPQTNNGVFTFGRDVNIRWKHGINALPPEDQDGKGRISIILWGLARNVIEEDGSPSLLGADGRGPHANHTNSNHKNHGRSNNSTKRRSNNQKHDHKRHGNKGKGSPDTN